jgi:uncharacterized protein (DUF1810 family)
VSDSFDLQRFVNAQAPVYRQVVEELSLGQKRTHSMWFIFPQIAGLGFSAMAQRFAIASRAEPSLTWSTMCSDLACSNARASFWRQAKRR